MARPPVPIPVTAEPRRDAIPPACLAPGLQLHLHPDGRVGPCCRSSRPYGRIPQQRLPELWADAWRTELVASLADGRFPDGCERCATEAALLEPDAVYAAEFAWWAERLEAERGMPWPVRMEFNLSNRCNLQCVQCDGDLSSSIRRHREHRGPLPPAYDDQFFDDLVPFLPHLRHASFAGGEPFLARENLRVWDLLEVHNPGLSITIITNGTQWNDRVERVLDRFAVDPVVSIDGFTAETFEQVRVGASRDQVFENLGRFAAYAAERGTTASINTCILRQNLHELVDLAVHADALGVTVNPLIVHGPPGSTLAHLDASDLRARIDEVERQLADLRRPLERNRSMISQVLHHLRSWSRPSDASTDASAWTDSAPAILQFRRHGRAALDASGRAAELAAWSSGPVHRLRVGLDELARGWSPDLEERLGLVPGRLEGRPLADLLPEIAAYEVIEEEEDRFLASMVTRSGTARLAMVPLRDADGRCDEVQVLIAFAASTEAG